MIPGKPKLGRPGDPGVVKVGGDDHGGHGYLNSVIDGYPLRFGLRESEKPESSKLESSKPVYRARKGK